MKTLLPIIYLLILGISLISIVYIIAKEIYKKRTLEDEFNTLRRKIETNREDTTSTDHYLLGRTYLSKKLFDQAIVQFSLSLKKWTTGDPIPMSNLYNAAGFAYFQSNQLDAAIYYYNEAINLDPKYTIALNNLGYAYEKNRLIEEAIKTYRKVLNYDTTNEIANQKMELLRRKLKNRDDRI